MKTKSSTSITGKLEVNNLINELSPCYRVPLQKLTFPQLVNKSSAFYGTGRFITVFTAAHHLPTT